MLNFRYSKWVQI